MDIITNYRNHLRPMAQNTQKVYMGEFKKFVEHFKGEDYRYISHDRIVEYLARLYDAGFSPSKVNQAINAIKFYKEKVLGQKRQTYFLKRPRSKKFLPPILPQQQMFDVINSPRNLKHSTMLFTIYDNGLRISEIINLKLTDVITKTEFPHIIIRDSKYNNTRTLYISEDCVTRIRAYYRQFKPKVYLFEGVTPGQPISDTTIANVLKEALKRNRIVKRFRVHDLRHNFATHCLLNGTDIYQLSLFLGHKSVATTEKYYAHLLPGQITIRRAQPVKEGRIIQIESKVA